MKYTILDCYTDEAAGLGVPPYIGTYPRYLAGQLTAEGKEYNYITIDDLRYLKIFNNEIKKTAKTNIKIYNLTNKEIERILNETDILYVICGVHVPGKYLSAYPGTLFEVVSLIRDLRCRKILTGPAATVFGTRLEGGKRAEKMPEHVFDEVLLPATDYDQIANFALAGSKLVEQIPYELIAEIETAKGCAKSVPCSFCTEKLKNKLAFRKIKDIVAEVKALADQGVKHFRLGKQSDFFAWSPKDIELMLSQIKAIKNIKTLHIDNVDPVNVTEEKVKLVVKYCTEGNIAALGVETFDPDIVKLNKLNSSPEITLKAIRIINRFGNEQGYNGMQRFLPGINILFGLIGETKKTHLLNMEFFQTILDENLLVRRVNVRQVAIFPGTQIEFECGDKYIKKNKKYYWKWRNDIRQNFDNPMLKKLVPVGTILKDVRMEIYDGNTTFGRQIGTYPLIIGVKSKLELGKYYDIKVSGHMLRSIVGEVNQ